MGVTLPKDMRFAGFKAGVIKAGLKSLARTSNAASFMTLKGVGENVRERAILFQELLDRKLVELRQNAHELTEAGEAIASGKAKTRTPLARAQMHVDQLLERIAAYNADPEGFLHIDQVWLYGSTMRGEETVGDIDIALSTSRRPPYDKNWDLMQRRVREVLRERGDSPANQYSPLFSGEDWLMRRAIFGERRHPLLAGVQGSTGDLEAIAAPCQLLYDRSRGGKVNDPILPQHPASEGRHESTPEQRTLPELEAGPARPMDAHWLVAYAQYGTVSPYDIFGSWEEAEPLFYRFPRNLAVLTDRDKKIARRGDWMPDALGKGEIDGSERVVLTNHNGSEAISVVLKRTIVEDDAGIRITATLEASEMLNVTEPGQDLYDDISSAITLLLATDADRVMRRQMDVGATKQVTIAIDNSGPTDDLRSMVASDTALLLEEGEISIVPEGWSGPAFMVERIAMLDAPGMSA